MHAARTVRAAADRHLVGIALNEADRFERHTEPFVHHLRINGLVALAVRVGTGDDHERTARVEADHHAFVHYPAFFDKIADAAAAQLAVFL